MENKKVLVFGDLPLSAAVVEYLRLLEGIELAGVVAYPRKKPAIDYFDGECLYDYAAANDIPIYTLEELPRRFEHKSLNFGVLTRFAKLLKPPVIDLFSERILNFHGGILPEYGGTNSSCHEILADAKYGGGTLHLISDVTVDTGDILKICSFEIADGDTSETVFKKTNKALYDGFVEMARPFFFGEPNYTPQAVLAAKGHLPRYYRKKDLGHELELDEEIKKRISVHARGFEFTGHERGFIMYKGQKIYFTTKNIEDFEVK